MISNFGSATIKNVVSGTTNEVLLNSDIAFEVTPNSGYGLLSYIVATASKVFNTTSTDLTAKYTSDSIKVTEDKLVDNVLTIALTFDKLLVIDISLGDGIGAIDDSIVSTVDEQKVSHSYKDDKLTVFESSNISMDIKTEKDENGQQYVINNMLINGSSEVGKVTKTSINNKPATEWVNNGEAKVEVQSAKLYNAEDREVKVDNVADAVGTISISVNEENKENVIYVDTQDYPTDNNPDDDTKFIIENSLINFNVTEDDDEYGFIGIKKGGVTTTKDHLGEKYTHSNGVHTLSDQAYTLEMSEAEALMLQKWYTYNNAYNRVIEVEVDSTIKNAQLINTTNGYAYRLSSGMFSTESSEPLYAGEWLVQVISASGGYTVTIEVYKGGSTPA